MRCIVAALLPSGNHAMAEWGTMRRFCGLGGASLPYNRSNEEGPARRGGHHGREQNRQRTASKNPLVKAIRELLEHRALWLYLLTDEAAKAGADPAAFAPAAVKRCGLFQGAELVAKGGGTNSLKSLKKGLFGKPAQMVFEMDVKDVQDDRFELEFHYCPLVKAWQKQGCTDEEISNLCDWAMCGDRGIGEAYGCDLDLPKTIARGDDVCHLIYHR